MRKTSITLIIILLLITVALIIQYGINVRYEFIQPPPLKGNLLYNPYHNIDTAKWQIANFHAHTHKIPDFFNETPRHTRYVDSLYTYLGYNIVGISDYQMINPFEKEHPWYVPAYEHGYMYFKNHHLVLNAKKVSWLDYIFKQTLDNKQYVINRLKEDPDALVTLVHPILRQALTHNDLKYLSNYDCFEVLDNKYQFLSFFDTVLSSGHHVFLMADDDSHNQKNQIECAACFNVINTVLVRDSILSALKTGRAFAVKLNLDVYKTNESKKTAIHDLPLLEAFDVSNDTIYLKFNKKVKTIKFIGQEGVERKSIDDTFSGACLFTKEDTYIRTEVECYDGTLFYLNPVLRYDGILNTDTSPAVNQKKTWISRSVIIAFLIICFSILLYKKRYV